MGCRKKAMETKSKCSRRYDAEFKQNAVALVQSGRTLRSVSGDLGCSTWSLRQWVAEEKSGGALSEPKTLAAETPDQREIRRLKQDNDYLRRPRDILKKPWPLSRKATSTALPADDLFKSSFRGRGTGPGIGSHFTRTNKSPNARAVNAIKSFCRRCNRSLKRAARPAAARVCTPRCVKPANAAAKTGSHG